MTTETELNELTRMPDGTSRSKRYLDAYGAAIRALRAAGELDQASDQIDAGDLGDEAGQLLDKAIDAANEHAHEAMSDYFVVMVQEVKDRVAQAHLEDEYVIETVEVVGWLAKELTAMADEYSSL